METRFGLITKRSPPQTWAHHTPGHPPKGRPSPRLKGSGREDARSYTASAMRFARTLLLCCLSLCRPAAAQPIPADDEAVKKLIHNHLSKIASPSIYSFAFEIAPTYAPGRQAEAFVLRWENEVAACIDEMQSGWEWLIRAGSRLDLTDAVGWDSSLQPEGCASFLDGVRSARYRQTHEEQDKRMREKQGRPETHRGTHLMSEPKTFRSLNFYWELPRRAAPGVTPSDQPPSTLPEVKREIRRVAAKRLADGCGPGEALVPRFEDDDPALPVYVRAGQGCDDFVIDIIQDPQCLLTLGAIHSDWKSSHRSGPLRIHAS